jgi:hypothetical protein
LQPIVLSLLNPISDIEFGRHGIVTASAVGMQIDGAVLSAWICRHEIERRQFVFGEPERFQIVAEPQRFATIDVRQTKRCDAKMLIELVFVHSFQPGTDSITERQRYDAPFLAVRIVGRKVLVTERPDSPGRTNKVGKKERHE